MVRVIALCLGVAALGMAAAAENEPITTGSLVAQMVDMHYLGQYPDPAYKTVQFSSYDHQSTLPGGPAWFGNSDGFGNEPTPNFEGVVQQPSTADGEGVYLICDVEGPGAIVRTWSARMEGTIRLFLDGASAPVFEGPSEDFLMRPYSRWAAEAGLGDAVLADTFYQRNAAYCPMPFAKRCRIEWVGKLKTTHFYQVQVRLYDKSTPVATFVPEDLKKYSEQIRRVSRILADPDKNWEYSSKQAPAVFDTSIEPGKKITALELPGPGAVERLAISLKAESMDKALRQTILHVMCDDYPWGQVQAPVGDFFGAAPGVNPYQSVPFTVQPDGTMICRYVMPFEKVCRILFENLGDQAVQVHGEALPMAAAWDPNRSMHFRARWRVDHDMVASGHEPQDLPVLIANGTGMYVGTAVMLLNPNCVPSSGGNWWGEGDEKIFVDSDVRPSTFGTGSEDYFNYAWSSEDIFLYPYCGQPRDDGPANRGFVTNYRWHIVDPLPFRQRLSFYIELFSHERTEDFSYARVGYHYARPGLMDDHVVITREDVRHLTLGPWKPVARGGARDSVFYEGEDILKSKKGIEFVENNQWSGGRLCRWSPKEIGQELVFDVPVPEDAKYAITIWTARDVSSGMVSVQIDGKPAEGGAKGKVDLYDPYRTLNRGIESKPVALKKGTVKVTLVYAGHREEVKNASVGVDFIQLRRR